MSHITPKFGQVLGSHPGMCRMPVQLLCVLSPSRSRSRALSLALSLSHSLTLSLSLSHINTACCRQGHGEAGPCCKAPGAARPGEEHSSPWSCLGEALQLSEKAEVDEVGSGHDVVGKVTRLD